MSKSWPLLVLMNIFAQSSGHFVKKYRRSEKWIFLKKKLGSLCRMVRVAKGLKSDKNYSKEINQGIFWEKKKLIKGFTWYFLQESTCPFSKKYDAREK
jgi:hypothetical protein